MKKWQTSALTLRWAFVYTVVCNISAVRYFLLTTYCCCVFVPLIPPNIFTYIECHNNRCQSIRAPRHHNKILPVCAACCIIYATQKNALLLDALGYLSNMRLISIKNVDNSDELGAHAHLSSARLKFFLFALCALLLSSSVKHSARCTRSIRGQHMRINVNTRIDYAMDNKFCGRWWSCTHIYFAFDMTNCSSALLWQIKGVPRLAAPLLIGWHCYGFSYFTAICGTCGMQRASTFAVCHNWDMNSAIFHCVLRAYSYTSNAVRAHLLRKLKRSKSKVTAS